MNQLEKAFKFWRANPVEAVKDWFQVTPTDYQGDIVTAMFTSGVDRIALKSGHGAGKSTILSWTGWLFLNFFSESRLVATAPTFPQLHDVLWPEYAKWHQYMPDGLRQQWEISGNHIRKKDNPKVHFAVSRTSNKDTNLQGFHGQNIMIQGDEASAIPPGVFEVIEGTLSEAGEEGKIAMLILAGNPNFTAGEFYNAFNKNKDLYVRYTLTGDPDLLHNLGTEQGEEHKAHGKLYYSSRISKKYYDTMKRKYGDGAVFDVRVRGVFPMVDDYAVVPLQWAEQALAIPVPRFDQIADPVTIVMDVARFGGDETVIGYFRKGVPIYMKTWPKTSTEQCVDILSDAHKFWTAQRISVQRIIIDEPGIGGGVIDSARRGGLAITPYNGGESLKLGRDPDDDIRMFANKRSRDWWQVRRSLELGQLPLEGLQDEVLVNQLASVRYEYNTKEKILIESKRKMRERLGDEASPDRADVLVMGSAPWYSFIGASAGVTLADIIEGDDRPEAEMDLW